MTIHAQASKLDMGKFAKVHRLMTEGATDGERAAAGARAEAMASRAGMTPSAGTAVASPAFTHNFQVDPIGRPRASIGDLGENVPESAEQIQSRINQWLKDEYSKPRRYFMAAEGVFYNRVPRRFRPLPLLYWFGQHSWAAAAPVVGYFAGAVPLQIAAISAPVLFVGSASLWSLKALSERKGSDVTQSDAIVRFGDLISAVKSGAVPRGKRAEAIRACLGILEIHARQITKVGKGEISVSLVEYVGSSQTKMTIRHRNPGNERPIGREFDGSNLLGHHACMAGVEPRVVHKLSAIDRGTPSPTQSKVSYNSLFFIPIEVSTSEGPRVRAFVSLDCNRPYAFYGNRSREIVVTCRPFVDQIKELLRENG